MAKSLRYFGGFKSVDGVAWKVELWQENAGVIFTPTRIELPSESPLVIEWAEVDKIEPIHSSSAQITVLSESDRMFVDMYQISVGQVRLDVFRNDALYWSGTLDTELYEEPYSYRDGYEVVLTFSDFAVLDRYKWSGQGMMTISALINDCLLQSDIRYTEVIKHISTSIHAYSAEGMNLEEIKVLSTNFYDEEGVAMTKRKVLTETLRPFALHVRQKNGKIYIYDLNALVRDYSIPDKIEWTSNDAVLTTDKVFNNVTVTLSPSAEAEMIKGSVKSKDVGENDGHLFYMNYHRSGLGLTLDALEGFRFCHGSDYESNMTLFNGAQFFQVHPLYSGSEETGVAWSVRAGHYGMGDEPSSSFRLIISSNAPEKVYSNYANQTVLTKPMIQLDPIYLAHPSIRYSEYSLRINLSLLFDVRYNPFEDSDYYNESGNWKHMQDWCNQGYVPIRLILRDSDGTAISHYENKQVLFSNSYHHTNCQWLAGEGAWGDAFLCYYDWDDRKSKTGFGGWKTNKPIIGYYRDSLPKQWRTMADGEYIPLPQNGGFLELHIGTGIHQFDWKREEKNILSSIRWVLYKEPTITLCRKNGIEVANKDIEDSAWINRDAADDLPVDTILGTVPERYGIPNARGQLFSMSDSIFYQFSRAGRTDRLERLLIGTIYSQYATRKNVLSGTTKITPTFGLMNDASSSGLYLMMAERQDLITGDSEIKISQIEADSYEGIDYQ